MICQVSPGLKKCFMHINDLDFKTVCSFSWGFFLIFLSFDAIKERDFGRRKDEPAIFHLIDFIGPLSIHLAHVRESIKYKSCKLEHQMGFVFTLPRQQGSGEACICMNSPIFIIFSTSMSMYHVYGNLPSRISARFNVSGIVEEQEKKM